MPGQITANRPGIDDRFPVAGFTIRTGVAPAWFEAVFTTRPELLELQHKSERNAGNFFSSRAQGALAAPRGEAVYIVPPEVLARFAGAQRLYYSMAVLRKPDFTEAEVARIPVASLPSVAISAGFTGRMRRTMIQNRHGSRSGNGYGATAPAALEWAGDSSEPGKMEPVRPAVPPPSNGTGAKNGASAAPVPSTAGIAAQQEYSDGFSADLWTRMQEAAEEDAHGIEGPIPDEGANIAEGQAVAFAITPEYPQASRFVPAASSNFRASSSPRTISRIVIHITDGGSRISGTIGWFQNSAAKVSAHYVVGQDGEVVQMVKHNDVAWHASRANSDSIGIEHVANTRGLAPTPAQYCASAALVNWLANQYGIPMDRQHILGHSEADPSTTHTGCPNAVWDWDYFMGMVTSATCYEPAAQSLAAKPARAVAAAPLVNNQRFAQGGARSMAAATPASLPARSKGAVALGESFDVNWSDVQLVPQSTDMSCWAAAAAMVVGWRDRVSIDPAEIARGAGRWAAYKDGLHPADVPTLARAWGLTMESPQSYTVDAFRRMLETHGPLWVAAAVPTPHVIVVTGLFGDGTTEGTRVRIKDPASDTPGVGSDYTLTYRELVQQYEGAAGIEGLNVQILHAGGNAGMFPGSASAQSLSARQPRAMSGYFDINWNDVQLVAQPTNMSCWAAAASMVVGWRDQMSIDPAEIARGTGRWAAYKIGLNPSDVPTLAQAWGLVMESPQCYTVDGFRQMIENNGPLWVAAVVPGLHAVVVTGAYGGGSPDDTYVRIKDPWGRAPGSRPGQPAPYNPTPGQGSEYSLTYTQFAQEYEGGAGVEGLNVQILHSGGTGGRTPEAGTTFALSRPPATAMEGATVAVVSAIAGAVVERLLNNEGDVRWELDQMRGLKHMGDNAANAGSAAYTTSTINIEGPHAATVYGLDEIYFDTQVTFQHNGKSLGNIQMAPLHSNDAAGAGLTVQARIMDDANTYQDSAGNRFAAIKIQFTYRFTFMLQDDFLAVTDVTLYGNGMHSERFRWTQ